MKSEWDNFIYTFQHRHTAHERLWAAALCQTRPRLGSAGVCFAPALLQFSSLAANGPQLCLVAGTEAFHNVSHWWRTCWWKEPLHSCCTCCVIWLIRTVPGERSQRTRLFGEAHKVGCGVCARLSAAQPHLLSSCVCLPRTQFLSGLHIRVILKSLPLSWPLHNSDRNRQTSFEAATKMQHSSAWELPSFPQAFFTVNL